MSDANEPITPPVPPPDAARPPAANEDGVALKPVPPAAVTTIVQTAEEPASRSSPERLLEDVSRLDRGLVLITLIFAFFVGSFVARNSDVWMHLATGRLIAQGNANFGHDPFDFTTPGVAWVNHSWLFDLGLYGVFQALGGTESVVAGKALVVLKALVVVLLAGVMLQIRRHRQGYWVPAVGVCLALLAMSQRLLLQSSVFSFLFLGITIFALDAWSRAPDPPQDDKGESGQFGWLIYLLPVLFILWVNVDDWFILGPVTVALFLLGQILQRGMAGDAARGRSLAPLVAVLVAGTACCLLNPFTYRAFTLPGELWAFFFSDPLKSDASLSGYFHLGIGREYLSRPEGWYYLGLLGVSAGSFFVLDWEKQRWWRIVVFGVFFLLSAALARAVAFFAVVAAPIAALNFQDYLAEKLGPDPDLSAPLRSWAIPGRVLTLVGGILLLAAAWPGWLHMLSDDARYTRRVAWDVEIDPSLKRAADSVRQMHENRIIGPESHGFNLSPDFANYCAWYAPEEKGFFDYRFPLFPEVQKDYLRIKNSLDPKTEQDREPAAWQALFRDPKYRIDHLVLSNRRREPSTALAQRFLDDPGQWTLLYADGRTYVFGWKDLQNRSASLRFASHGVDFDRLAFASEVPADQRPPEEGAEAPQPRGFLTRYLAGPPEQPLEADEASFYWTQYKLASARWPAAFQATNWVTCWLPCLSGSAGGAAVMSGPATLAAGLRIPPDLKVRGQPLGPPGLLVLALRAARRAVKASPDSAEPYLILAEAYQDVWTNQEEIWTGGRAVFLRQLRQVQLVNALKNAQVLRPDLAAIEYALARTYQQLGYVDLEMEARENALKDLRVAGPSPNDSPDRFNLSVQFMDNELQQRQTATNFERRRNDFELASAGGTPLERAKKAVEFGLIKQALDVLLESDTASYGRDEAELVVPLLLSTGQADLVRKNEFRLGPWYDAMIAGAMGSYKQFDEILERMVNEKELSGAAQALLLVRAETFQSGVTPSGLADVNRTVPSIYEGIELHTIRGAMALEAGLMKDAARDLRRAVDHGSKLNGETPKPAAGGIQVISAPGVAGAFGRPAAAAYLALIRADGR